MVPVLMRRDDGGEAAGALVEQRKDPCGIVGGVDEQLGTREHAGQQIDVVGHLADACLSDCQQRKVPLISGSGSGHVPRLVNARLPSEGAIVTTDYFSSRL